MTVYKPARPAVGTHRSTIENFIEENRAQVYCYENKENDKNDQVFLIHGALAQKLLTMVGTDLTLLDRDTCEHDHSHVHLITYVGLVLSAEPAMPGSVLTPRVGLGPMSSYDVDFEDKAMMAPPWKNAGLFSYTRSKQGGEGRLYGKQSIGIGGHVERIDASGPGLIYRTLGACLMQELEEEVGLFKLLQPAHIRQYLTQLSQNILIDIFRSQEVVLIYEPSSEVGRHHLGVYVPLVLNARAMTQFEDTIAEPTLHVFADAAPVAERDPNAPASGELKQPGEVIVRDLADVPVFCNYRQENWEAWSAALLDLMRNSRHVINTDYQVRDEQRAAVHPKIDAETESKGIHLKPTAVSKEMAVEAGDQRAPTTE